MTSNPPPPPDIAILTPSLTGGGAERVAVNLGEGLVRHGVRPHVITFAARAGREMDEQRAAAALERCGVRVSLLAEKRALRALPALTRMLRRERPRALISHLEYLNIAAVLCNLAARRVTRVIAVNHCQFSVELRNHPLRYQSLFRLLVRSCYPLAHRIVCVSQSAADDLARTCRLPRHRLDVIYNPVIGAGFEARASAPLQHPWFAAGTVPVFISAGRLVPIKDFGTLIAAFQQVRRVRHARLAIFGDGPLRNELEAEVRERRLQNDICFMGYVENLPAYMRRARAFVVSSLSEALPTALIEAMAAGCRVISTDCPGGVREVLENGSRGELVPMGDVGALSKAMLAELAGELPTRPASGTWRQFQADAACRSYLRLCLGASAS